MTQSTWEKIGAAAKRAAYTSILAIPLMTLTTCEKWDDLMDARDEYKKFKGSATYWDEIPNSTLEIYCNAGDNLFGCREIPTNKKLIIRGDTIDAWIKFDESCVYDSMRTGCEGDWNKLIGKYRNDDVREALDNTNNGAFCWRTIYNPDAKERSLEIGHYTHYDGYPDADNGVIKNKWFEWIQPETWYHLRFIDTGNEYEYWYSESQSSEWLPEDKKRVDPHRPSENEAFMKPPEFGGDCPAPEYMSIELSKSNPNGEQ